jgi:hypothetical protein
MAEAIDGRGPVGQSAVAVALTLPVLRRNLSGGGW